MREIREIVFTLVLSDPSSIPGTTYVFKSPQRDP